jgi:molybdopterin-binding protein
VKACGISAFAVGRDKIVLIKAPFVMIAPGTEPPSTSARNCVPGIVKRCEISAVNAEIVLDIGGGTSLAASVTAHSATALDLAWQERLRAVRRRPRHHRHRLINGRRQMKPTKMLAAAIGLFAGQAAISPARPRCCPSSSSITSRPRNGAKPTSWRGHGGVFFRGDPGDDADPEARGAYLRMMGPAGIAASFRGSLGTLFA